MTVADLQTLLEKAKPTDQILLEIKPDYVPSSVGLTYVPAAEAFDDNDDTFVITMGAY